MVSKKVKDSNSFTRTLSNGEGMAVISLLCGDECVAGNCA